MPIAPLPRADHAVSGSIAPGTQITIQNWRQYTQFMPEGMRDLFEGKYFWKMPADVELEIPLFTRCPKITCRRASRDGVGPNLPDGRLNFEGYGGGESRFRTQPNRTLAGKS